MNKEQNGIKGHEPASMTFNNTHDLGFEDGFTLRLLEDGDAEDLFHLLKSNYDYLKRWVPFPGAPLELSDARKYINDGSKQRLTYAGVPFGIFFQSKLIGFISYRKPDWVNRIIGIGYWIDASYQGKGLVTKACEILTDFAFKALKMNRVEIACAWENEKSQAVAKRLGFCKEGIIREAEYVNGRYVNHVIYGMLAIEWEARSASPSPPNR